MLRIRLVALTLLLLLFFCNPLHAQTDDVKFERLNIEQGLSESTVRCLLQDRRGFIWLGTQNGLNQYDGYAFNVFRPERKNNNSLSEGFISSLFEDSEGTLWIGTLGSGLNKYEPKSRLFITYRHDKNNPHSLSSDQVNSVIQDRTGALWVGTSDGLNKFDLITQRFTAYRHDPNDPQSLNGNLIESIYQDHSGTLWIATDKGLNRFDATKQSFVSVDAPNNVKALLNSAILSLYEDSSGSMWFGTVKGLINYNPNNQNYTIYQNNPNDPNSLSNNVVRAICQDQAGALWIGTNDGLNRFDPISKRFTVYRHDPKNPHSLSSNLIYSVIVSKSGIVWVGTNAGGVNKVDPNKFRFNTSCDNPLNLDSPACKEISAICEDSTGVLWLGTTNSGLNSYEPATGRTVTYRHDQNNPNSLSNDGVRAVCQDRSGMLWVGTIDGLNKFDPSTQRFTVYRHNPQKPNSLSNNQARVVYQDRNGMLWIGTNNGLNRFDPTTDSFVIFRNDPDNPNSLSHNFLTAIHEDNKGQLWIGTGKGLNKFVPETQSFITFYNDPANLNSLTEDFISSICTDNNGMLWIGTGNSGLNMYNPQTGRFTAFTEKEGLVYNTIAAILSDNEGNIWVSTAGKGIVKLDTRTGKFKNYDVKDGLNTNIFKRGVAYKSNRGEMFFGGMNGFSRFFPQQIKDNDYVPPIAITALKVFDKPITDVDLNPLKGAAPVEFTYKQNFLTFEFVALNYTNAENNRYAYKLDGVDPDWVYCGTRRFASYPALKPGSYVFRVKGANNDGIWNEAGTAIAITVNPPLWLTWWAYGIYLGLISGGIYGGVRLRIHLLKRRNEMLEAEIKLRTNELAEKVVQLDQAKQEVEQRNEELIKKNDELIESQKRTDIIFSALSEVLPGTILNDKYRLDKKIGAGGFGIVYRGTHMALNRTVAIKVLQPYFNRLDIEKIERFHVEAISACRVNHPNAVSILDFGITSEGIPYIVMEYLQGKPLSEEFDEQLIFSPHRCAEIILPICDVLAAAHAAGIVHRDIKPDNIFLHNTPDGEKIKVLDFGIAKLLTRDDSVNVQPLTLTGNIVGTPNYMSPERFESRPFDGRADVYSLGVILYRMLCGRLPFESEQGDIWSIGLMHLNDEPVPLRQYNPALSPELEAIVLSTLAKDYRKRPTAKELAKQFAKAAEFTTETQRF